MKSMSPYLNLNGQAKMALEFYKGIFGGDLNMMTYGQLPAEDFESIKENKSPEFHSYFGETEADRVPANPAKSGDASLSEKAKNLIYHGMLMSPKFCLMASDMGAKEETHQKVVCIGIDAEDMGEFDKIWNGLKAGNAHAKPQVIMAPYKPSWGQKYGMIMDQFNVCWQINLS